MPGRDFDLQSFLPYLLNQAAEVTSRGFQATYRAQHGLSRTQWRVLANLGRFGAMTARDICRISHIEKTKVSRAVAAMEVAGLLVRATSPVDRRAENLTLTAKGRELFAEVGRRAIDFDADLRDRLGPDVADRLDRILRDIIAMAAADPAPEDD